MGINVVMPISAGRLHCELLSLDDMRKVHMMMIEKLYGCNTVNDRKPACCNIV